MRGAAAVLIFVTGCGHPRPAVTSPPPSAPAAPAPTRAAPARPAPPITECPDLRLDAIAGIQLGKDEATVRAAVGAATQEFAPTTRFEPMIEHQRWTSTAVWRAHDLHVEWTALVDASAPRTVSAVGIGPDSDLATSCGVRIGTPRAEVERAYRGPIAVWTQTFGAAAAAGYLAAPAAAASTTVVLASADGAIIGLVELTDDRVTGILFMSGAVLYANQW